MTEDAFDAVRHPLDPGLAREVVDEQATGQPAGATDALRGLVSALLAERVDGAPGWFVLTGADGLSEAEARSFTLATSSAVGELLPQDASGNLLREVRYRGVRLGEGRTGRYSDSKDGGSLHTDGAPAPPPLPDCFSLHCVRQAPHGGALVLVHVEDILARLADRPGVADELAGEFHFDRRDDRVVEPTVVKPILWWENGRPAMCYLREYIELGHHHATVPDLTARQLAALDELDRCLDDPALQHVGRLRVGETIVINNKQLLHGRTAFEDGEEDQSRLMLRTWVLRPLTNVREAAAPVT